jgi:hypothetical protein
MFIFKNSKIYQIYSCFENLKFEQLLKRSKKKKRKRKEEIPDGPRPS